MGKDTEVGGMLRKFATAMVLDKFVVPADAGAEAMRRIAHRHEFQYDVRPGYLYVRSRMISSRCNDNYDEFPAEEIKKAYRTFVGKPVFVNHNNEDHRRARGVIIDAALHDDRNPDGTPDLWVEGLMEIDAVRFPMLAKAIVAGHVDRTSMGTDVAFSVCSICNNKATTPLEYCRHIPAQKGRRIFRANPKTGKRVGVLVRETCYGLSFFENSLLVEPPADPTAFFTGVDARGLSAHAARHPEAPKGKPTPKRQTPAARRQEGERLASLRAVVAEGEEAGPPPNHRPQGDPVVREEAACATCGGAIFHSKNGDVWIHSEQTGGGMPHQANPGEEGYDGASGQMVPQNKAYESHSTSKESHLSDGAHSEKEMDDYNRGRRVDLEDPIDLKSHLMETHGWAPEDFHQHAMDRHHPALGDTDGASRPYTSTEVQHIHAFEHTPAGGGHDFPDARVEDGMHRHASLVAEAKPKYEDPGEHPAMKALGLHPGNVVGHWDMATDEEKGQGKNWYEDAHHIAKAIAGGDAHKGAGVLAAYSPQTAWPANMFNASRSFREGKAIGGKGSGVMASGQMRDAAQRIMNGERHEDVFKGNKISDFAHLIEHGGNKDDNDPKVVVDRHALSVAAGRRLPETETGPAQAAIANRHYYQHAVDTYHQAAKHINERDGRTGEDQVKPHEVQAVTWLARQRMNQKEDRDSGTAMGKGRASGFEKAHQQWLEHARNHYDGLEGNMHMALLRAPKESQRRTGA
jgi:hypothetical protein